jgi:hypothetical protein
MCTRPARATEIADARNFFSDFRANRRLGAALSWCLARRGLAVQTRPRHFFLPRRARRSPMITIRVGSRFSVQRKIERLSRAPQPVQHPAPHCATCRAETVDLRVFSHLQPFTGIGNQRQRPHLLVLSARHSYRIQFELQLFTSQPCRPDDRRRRSATRSGNLV